MDSEPRPKPPAAGGADVGEVLLGVGAAIFGVAIVWQTTQIRLTPAYSTVGPRVIPYIVGASLIAIGIWLAIEALTGRGGAISTESEDADPTLPTDWRTVGMLTVALLAYLVLLQPAGFIIASTVLFAGAAFAMGSRHVARDIIAGLLMATVLYVGFTRGLDLRLPAGVLAGIL